jgi:hypothetical protein
VPYRIDVSGDVFADTAEEILQLQKLRERLKEADAPKKEAPKGNALPVVDLVFHPRRSYRMKFYERYTRSIQVFLNEGGWQATGTISKHLGLPKTANRGDLHHIYDNIIMRLVREGIIIEAKPDGKRSRRYFANPTYAKANPNGPFLPFEDRD